MSLSCEATLTLVVFEVMVMPIQFDATPLAKLVRYSVWANDRWIDEVAARFTSDEFLMARMSHILLGEAAWLSRVRGDSPDRDIWRLMTLEELRATHARHRVLYDGLLRSDLSRVIAYRRFTGESYQSPIADLLVHVVLHGVHHRGQMATRVSALGAKPANTDFVQYCLTAGV